MLSSSSPSEAMAAIVCCAALLKDPYPQRVNKCRSVTMWALSDENEEVKDASQKL